MKKKSTPAAFTSLRIIGAKAQRFLERARAPLPEGPKSTRTRFTQDNTPEMIVHISLRSIVNGAFAVLAILGGVFVIYMVQDKIVLMVLALFVAAIVDPGVQALKKRGVPRGIAILFHYIVFLSLFVFLIVSLIPVIADQIQQIASILTRQVNDFLSNPQIALPFLSLEFNMRLTEFTKMTIENLSITHFADALRQLGQAMATTAQGSLVLAAHLAGSVLNFFINTVIVLVTAFFIQIEKERIMNWARGFVPWKMRSYVDDKSEAIQWKLALWIRGQLTLCLTIGLLVFLALVILRMPYAITLATLAGFTEFIPIIGPFIAAVPAVLIAFTEGGWFWAFVVALTYWAIQWCENNLIVPLVMKRAVGLSAVAITFAMLVGVSFPDVIHPVFGIILSIPITTILALFLNDWRARHSPEEKIK